ncbi:MAG: hypothetical protein CVU57_18255 [Deltaproteobacteria bacterium HGW-Deltaproteobacteria-15]|nr:MAG: hypothetical protein CVU57_18255 [Deltaproteobacteria bacterium HGW-Deltaproteobacteria-15]
MKYRLTLVYLAAAIILVGLYFYETRTEQEKTESSFEATRLFQSRAEQIDGVTIVRKSGEITLEKSDDKEAKEWQITAPLKTGADTIAVDALTRSIADLRYERMVSESTDYAQFGLDDPELTVSFRAGEKGDSIAFGATNPLGNSVYARKGEGRKVYLISAAARKELDKDLYDLRNKVLFSLVPEQVNRVVLVQGSEKWSFTRKEKEWFMEGDESLKVDQERVESLIRETITAFPASFEEEKASDLGAYGLSLPKARVALSNGRKTEEILYGDPLKRKEKEGFIYAAVAGKPKVVSVRKRLLEDLPKTKEEFKQKDPEKKQEGGATE